MEIHSEALNCLCRLCAGPLSKYSHNKLALSKQIEKVLGIDVNSDETFVHPPRLCDKCRRLLQKYYKEIQSHKKVKVEHNSFQISSWVPHSENCKVCDSHIQPDIREQDSDSFISKCSEIILRHGYLSTSCQDDVILSYAKIHSSAEKIHSRVKIFKDKTFSVTVLGRQVENALIVSETKVSSPDILLKILDVLHTRKLCKGSTGFSDLFSTPVFERNGDVVAYVESGYGTETTIRHKDCPLFLQETDAGSMCTTCSIFKSNLFRQRKRKSDVSSTETHSKRPNISLSGPEMLKKLKSITREKKAIKRKLDLTNKMLSDQIEKNGILLDDKMADGFKTIIEKKQDEVYTTFAPGSPQQLLWKQQTEALRSSKYAMRWHPTFLRWCISLYGKSPSAYKMVKGSKFLVLPHESTLLDYTNYFKVAPGINVEILKSICEESDGTFRRNVTIIFDEIKIKSNLVYSKSTGTLKGFTECGDINDIINGFVNKKIMEEDDELATHVIAFMVRGIFTPLKQVFAYYPCKGFTAHQLYWSVWDAVAALESGGFQVRVLVSDGASPNRKFYRLHGDNADGSSPLYYTVNRYSPERRIYFLCDVPHLIKTTRNNLENSNWNKKTRHLKLNGEALEWTKLVELLKLDLQGEGFRLLPKLTYEHLHLNPSLRMKVKLAAQVLSSSVSKALLVTRQQNVAELSKFIAIIDQFFDCLNVSTVSQGNLHPTRKPYTGADDWRLIWLEKDFLGFLDDWESKCLQEAGLTMAERRRLCLSRETLEGLRITVKSFVSLVKDLLQVNGVEYILSEKFSQDPIEEFFGKVRGFHGHNNHPTVQQFESALSHITILSDKDLQATTRGNITRGEQDTTIVDTPLPKRRGR